MIRMLWNAHSVPHLVLEINGECNISCQECYKKLDGTTKPLIQIIDELQIALSNRKIHTVSIAGGEPTIHPQLCEIVRIIHKKNLKVALITNGLLLDNYLLNELKKSGLNIIMFHIDEGQNRPDLPQNPTIEEINFLRTVLTEQAAKKGIDSGLSVTIYPEYLHRVPSLIEYILNSKHINFLLATNYIDINRLTKVACSRKQNKDKHYNYEKQTNQQIVEVFRDNFGLEPFAHLPSNEISNREENDLRWLTYFIPVIYFDNKREIFKMKSNLLDSFLISIPKFITGKFMFYCKPNPFVIAVQVFCNSLTTARLKECLKFFFNLRFKGALLSSKRFIFEGGLTLTNNGEIICCFFCPNATVRNNKLVHLCVADYINHQD